MKKQLLIIASLLVFSISTKAQLNFAPNVVYGTGTIPYALFFANFSSNNR